MCIWWEPLIWRPPVIIIENAVRLHWTVEKHTQSSAIPSCVALNPDCSSGCGISWVVHDHEENPLRDNAFVNPHPTPQIFGDVNEHIEGIEVRQKLGRHWACCCVHGLKNVVSKLQSTGEVVSWQIQRDLILTNQHVTGIRLFYLTNHIITFRIGKCITGTYINYLILTNQVITIRIGKYTTLQTR